MRRHFSNLYTTMILPLRSFLAPLCLVAIWLSSSTHAAVMTFTDDSAFRSALLVSGTDTFDGLSDQTPINPLYRSAGPYTYDVAATGDGLFVLQLGGDAWLSTATTGNVLTLSGFSAPIHGAGGNFFATDLPGEFLTDFPVELVYIFAGETVSFTITPQTTGDFFAVLGDSSLLQLVIRNVDGAEFPQFVTVNDLVIGTDTPEPAAWILTSLGICALAGLRRHLRSV